jgi:hypothetical protein
MDLRQQRQKEILDDGAALINLCTLSVQENASVISLPGPPFLFIVCTKEKIQSPRGGAINYIRPAPPTAGDAMTLPFKSYEEGGRPERSTSLSGVW